MQYNENYMLPVFLDHYSRFLDPKHIKVIDHGSTDIDDHSLSNYERIYIPRSRPFSEGSRLRAVQNIVSALLEYYDFGIFVDCDELIDLTNIHEIDFTNQKIHYVAGFTAFFRNTSDGLRLRGLLEPGYCKPSIFSSVPNWTVGFHYAGQPLNILKLPMIHINRLYGIQSMNRITSRNKVYQHFLDHEKQSGINVHWNVDLTHFNDFFDYVNKKDHTDVKTFEPIDPYLNEIHTGNSSVHQKSYKFSNVEYDFTEAFPHIVNNYIKELTSGFK